ncbi:MAG: nickel pincer cofactor biosynthesis protein LarB [Actinomycetota bacterium]|nr:nickel pincer cofactor biosynthesis protein LarB [Actinomycetota bacterium]
MRPEEVAELLEGVRAGHKSPDQALAELRRLPYDDLEFARLDTHRELRQGLPEAVYGEGKTTEQIVAIAERLIEKTSGPVIATRVSADAATALQDRFETATHYETARLVVVRQETKQLGATVTVVCAGTSDLPVAEEASATAQALGADVIRVTDVGVAGLHRLLNEQETLLDADVVVVVAGMEGALASLVGGITPAPVIAVPTSVGYGASFGGLAALLAMLNSCAQGITVTNIDNGFGAAMAAIRILRSNR